MVDIVTISKLGYLLEIKELPENEHQEPIIFKHPDNPNYENLK